METTMQPLLLQRYNDIQLLKSVPPAAYLELPPNICPAVLDGDAHKCTFSVGAFLKIGLIFAIHSSGKPVTVCCCLVAPSVEVSLALTMRLISENTDVIIFIFSPKYQTCLILIKVALVSLQAVPEVYVWICKHQLLPDNLG